MQRYSLPVSATNATWAGDRRGKGAWHHCPRCRARLYDHIPIQRINALTYCAPCARAWVLENHPGAHWMPWDAVPSGLRVFAIRYRIHLDDPDPTYPIVGDVIDAVAHGFDWRVKTADGRVFHCCPHDLRPWSEESFAAVCAAEDERVDAVRAERATRLLAEHVRGTGDSPAEMRPDWSTEKGWRK